MSAGVWTPALTGADAQRALAAALALARVVRDAPPSGDPSLATGDAGRAVALSHLDDAFGGEGFAAAASDALRASVRGVAAARVDASLMMGFTGVAWATAHLAGRAGADAETATRAADTALIDVLERGAWRGGFELVAGVCGVGVYALERLPSPIGRRLLELVVETLETLSEPRDGGVTWLAAPQHLHPWSLARAPRGYYDIGLAHGVPGPVGVLGGALAAGVDGGAGALLDGALAWLEAQTLDDDADSLLPYGVGDDAAPAPARLAWCYGDPGACAALLLAARAGNARAAALAARALARIARRPDATAGVQGASLCHGTAGLAHVCGRLGVAPTAHRYARLTAAAAEEGFVVFDPHDPSTPSDVQGIGLLGGLAGVALALTAAASPAEPSWDRALLISLPPELGR